MERIRHLRLDSRVMSVFEDCASVPVLSVVMKVQTLCFWVWIEKCFNVRDKVL